MNKRDELSQVLQTLWAAYGPSTDNVKTAAASYFYKLQKPSFDREALGVHFCKLAGELRVDPWALAHSVEQNLPAYKMLAKTAADVKTQRLAQYYVDWAQGIEKKALVPGFGAIKSMAGKAATKARGLFRRGAGKTQWSSEALRTGTPAKVQSGVSQWKPQAKPAATHTLGEKLLGGAALAGGIGVPAAMMMGGGEQQAAPQQYGYYQ